MSAVAARAASTLLDVDLALVRAGNAQHAAAAAAWLEEDFDRRWAEHTDGIDSDGGQRLAVFEGVDSVYVRPMIDLLLDRPRSCTGVDDTCWCLTPRRAFVPAALEPTLAQAALSAGLAARQAEEADRAGDLHAAALRHRVVATAASRFDQLVAEEAQAMRAAAGADTLRTVTGPDGRVWAIDLTRLASPSGTDWVSEHLRLEAEAHRRHITDAQFVDEALGHRRWPWQIDVS